MKIHPMILSTVQRLLDLQADLERWEERLENLGVQFSTRAPNGLGDFALVRLAVSLLGVPPETDSDENPVCYEPLIDAYEEYRKTRDLPVFVGVCQKFKAEVESPTSNPIWN